MSGKLHGLVVPFGTSGMVQVDRPLVLVPLVPRRSEDPILLVPLVQLRSEDPPLLVPLVPRLQLVPTCSIWLYHLSFTNSLFSDFFWVSQRHSIFRKTLLNEKFSSKYYHVGEGMNDNQISTKRQETTMTIHSNTWVYFV